MAKKHPLTVFRERQDPPLRQSELAKRLRVSRATVSRWESGKRQPEEEQLQVIHEKTGIAPSEIRPRLARLMQTEAA